MQFSKEVVSTFQGLSCDCCRQATITGIYTLSLHDALPILTDDAKATLEVFFAQEKDLDGDELPNEAEQAKASWSLRSEEHTSELQSRRDLVCRLLLEKKNQVHLCDLQKERSAHCKGITAIY